MKPLILIMALVMFGCSSSKTQDCKAWEYYTDKYTETFNVLYDLCLKPENEAICLEYFNIIVYADKNEKEDFRSLWYKSEEDKLGKVYKGFVK